MGADLPPPAFLPPLSAPSQIVTGSADMISGRVADPAGDRVDAIHVYRDLNGNGVIDLGIDQLLQADTTPADGYAFDAGSLPSGRHVLYVAAMKDGAVAGSITTTLVAARWWSVSIGSLTDGESRLPTTGDLQADPTPIELAPGPGGGTWKDAVRSRVSGTLTTTNPGSQESHDYGFPEPGSDYTVPAPGSAFAIGTARELRAAFGPRHGIAVAADTRLIVLEDLVKFTSAVNDNDYDDQYFVVTLTPVLVDLDVDSDNTGILDRTPHEDDIEEATDANGAIVRPGVIVPVGPERVKMIAEVPAGMTATLEFAQGVDMVRVYAQATGGEPLLEKGDKLSTRVEGSGEPRTFWIEAFAPSASMADIAFTLTLNVGTGSGSAGSPPSDMIRATAVALDVDVDSDNVGGVQRSAAEDAIEDIADIDATPGLYLQVQDEDSDGDGLVNWADGFNGIGDELAVDDVSAGATFAPLWFRIPEAVYAPDATLEIIYSASDPSAAVMDPHYLSWDRPTDGHLRIWTKDAFLPRNRHAVQDGGDYVTPTSRTARSYTLAELGLQPGDNLLFLEAIRESTTTAQQAVTFRLTPRLAGKPAAFTIADTVRVTTARIEVLADNRDGTPAFPTFSLTATPMPNPNAGLSGLVPDITQAYTINVYDPRGPQTIHTTYVAGTPLPLVQSGTARYTTPQFLAVPEEDLPLIGADLPVEGLLDGPLHPSDVIGQAIVVPVSGTMVQIRYNGETTLGLIKKAAAEKAIALLKEVVLDVDAGLGDFKPGNENGKNVGGDQGPGLYDPKDAGAMGKEAEARIHRGFDAIAKDTTQPKARRDLASQFRKGIIVDATGIVKKVANDDGDAQLDLVFVRKGYEPVVGQRLDKNSVIVIEVRSSLDGSLTKSKLAAREALSVRRVAVANFNWRYKQAANGLFEVAEHNRLKGLVVFLERHGKRIVKVAPIVCGAGAFIVTNLDSRTYAKSEEIFDQMLDLGIESRHDQGKIIDFAGLVVELINTHFGDSLDVPAKLQARHLILGDDDGQALIEYWIEVSPGIEKSTFNR
jgi:hypothetical protein